MIAQLKSAHDKLVAKGNSEEEALKFIIEDHTELTEEQVITMLQE